MNNLSESSVSYTTEASVYQEFSKAQDWPQLLNHLLVEEFRNKDVVDVGCGNGKYARLLAQFTKSFTGIDKSIQQIEYARIQCRKSLFIHHDGIHLPFENSSKDAILSSWMLGTLDSDDRRIKVILEMKRILKENGKIILIENDTGGEFEQLRGRTQDDRTQKYNDFLQSQGFKIKKRLTTYFHFSSSLAAQSVFKKIWADKLTREIKGHTISQNIVIFEYIKNNLE